MKICCISDTHLQHRDSKFFPEIPDADILIHAGDLTYYGDSDEIRAALEWLQSLPHKRKIFVAGNHDMLFEEIPQKARLILNEFPGLTYLQDSAVEFDGVKIYGSPWTPEFCQWGFMRKRGAEIAEKWAQIPDGIDVLVTHGPAFGYGDEIYGGERVGCVDLYEAIARTNPKLHVFGHIHHAYGQYTAYHAGLRTKFVNAAICNEAYQPVNSPTVVEL